MSRWGAWLVAISGVLAIAGALGTTGCSGGPPSPSPSPPPRTAVPPLPEPRLPSSLDEPDVGNACREQVAGLEEWLSSIERAGLPLALSLLDEGTHLVERPGPVVREAAPLVHVTPEHVYLDGVPVGVREDGDSGLRAELTELIDLRRSMMPESPFIQSPRCYLAVDRSVTWERLTGVVEQAAISGVKRLTLLFRDPTRSIPAPPPSPIDREIDRMQRGTQLRRQQITAELLAYVYQDCPQGLKVIASMGVNPVADFKQVILGDFPAAIGACGCAPDDASVKALHWAIFGNPRPTSGVTVGLAPVTAADPSAAPAGVVTVALPGDRTWQQAHESLARHAVADDAASEATPTEMVRLVVEQSEPNKGKAQRSGPRRGKPAASQPTGAAAGPKPR